MDRSLRILVLGVLCLGIMFSLPQTTRTAYAVELDKKSKADAKEAMRLYKEGNYEDAAKLFLKLSIAYPEMLVFVRNLGACYYYMRKFEPALSNLRDYEHRKRDITSEDRAEVDGWIAELERLRDQASVPPVPAPPPVAATPVPTPPAAAVATPTPPADTPAVSPPPPAIEPAPAQSANPSASPSGSTPSQPAAGYPAGGGYPVQPNDGYPQGNYPQQPAPGNYGAQQNSQPAPYPGQSFGYPSNYPPAYPQAGYQPPTGVSTPAAQPPASSGSGRKILAWTVGLAGVATVGLGAYFTVSALDKFSAVEKKYDPSTESQGKSYATDQWICYGIGAAAITAGIIIGSTGGSSSPVALVPTLAPGTAGATLSGHF